MTPTEREQAIQDLGQQIIKHQKEGRKNQAQICFHTMAALIGGRAEETIKQMENERGLSNGTK